MCVRAYMFVRALVCPCGIFWESDYHHMSPKKRKNVEKTRFLCVSTRYGDFSRTCAKNRKMAMSFARQSHILILTSALHSARNW